MFYICVPLSPQSVVIVCFVVAMASSSSSSRRCRNCNLCCVHDLCIFCQSSRRCNHCLRHLPDHCFRNYDADVCAVSLKSVYLFSSFLLQFCSLSIRLSLLFIHFVVLVYAPVTTVNGREMLVSVGWLVGWLVGHTSRALWLNGAS